MSSSAHAKRERDAEVARQAILDAAEEVFAKNGFDGARIDAIAAASGYNKSLIFHYFGDKLGLYREIVLRVREQFQGWFARVLAPLVDNDAMPLDAGTVRAFLETFIRWYFNMLVEHPRLLRMVAWEAAEGWHTFTSLQRKPEEIEMSLSIIDFIQRAQKAGFIEAELDPLLLIFNMVNLCMYHVISTPLLQQLMDSTGVPVPELAQVQDQIVKLVLRGALVPQKEADHETHL
jgi:TetR/AcrR family transcriptional regulator